MTWDNAQQYVRIGLYGATGWLVNRGYVSGEVGDWLAASLLGGANLLWTWFWNRQRAAG